MLSKTIKDPHILVGAYAQWLVINSYIKETLEDKALEEKLKNRVDEIISTLISTTKGISELTTTVASANKAADQMARKVRILKK